MLSVIRHNRRRGLVGADGEAEYVTSNRGKRDSHQFKSCSSRASVLRRRRARRVRRKACHWFATLTSTLGVLGLAPPWGGLLAGGGGLPLLWPDSCTNQRCTNAQLFCRLDEGVCLILFGILHRWTGRAARCRPHWASARAWRAVPAAAAAAPPAPTAAPVVAAALHSPRL